VNPVPTPAPVLTPNVVIRTQPAIFSDDAILNGGGLEFHPEGSHLRIRAEANIAYNFFPADRGRTWEPDYRFVLGYDREFEGRLVGPIGALMFGQVRRDSLFSEIEGSAGFYSRYGNNGIGYIQARDGVNISRNPSLRLAPYFTARIVKDTKNNYYNNVVDVGGGFEVKPRGDFNMSMRTEYLFGHYFGTSEQPNPFAPKYHTLRLTLRLGYRVIPGGE